MIEQQVPQLSQDERLERAVFVWWATFAAMVDYAREQGQSAEAITTWLGQRWSPTWDQTKGDLARIARSVAVNGMAVGGEVRGFDVREDEAVVRMSIPPAAVESGGTEYVDRAYDSYQPIMDYLDLDYSYQHDGDVTTVRLRPRS